MDDRQLLELAARAAGMPIGADGWMWWPNMLCFNRKGERGESLMWNPLTDDGDALRLAVKLKLAVTHYGDVVTAGPWALDQDAEEWTGVIGADPYAATRRAIVRAAASLAKEQS